MEGPNQFSLHEAIDRICDYCVLNSCLGDRCPIEQLASYHSDILDDIE